MIEPYMTNIFVLYNIRAIRMSSRLIVSKRILENIFFLL